MPTGIAEFDRMLGGGIVRGSVTLIGGEPGIGKSTLMLQICEALAAETVLYISGEESLAQIKGKLTRLNLRLEKTYFTQEVELDQLKTAIDEHKPALLVVDSIQTLYSRAQDGLPGSVNQIREVALTLVQQAKSRGMAVLLVGHITKDGSIAGPKILEHLVDSVVYFESDIGGMYRMLRCWKNRFGATNEIGLFSMSTSGLAPVDDPSQTLFCELREETIGSALTTVVEGTRPLLVEIQALVVQTHLGIPRRTSMGVDSNRLNILAAVIEKVGDIRLGDKDIYLKVAGGMKIVDPAADLGVAAAILSSYFSKPLSHRTAYIGEIDLTGRLRTVSHLDARIAELEKLAFAGACVPVSDLSLPPLATGVPDLQAFLAAHFL